LTLSYTEPIKYQTYLITNPSDTESIWLPSFHPDSIFMHNALPNMLSDSMPQEQNVQNVQFIYVCILRNKPIVRQVWWNTYLKIQNVVCIECSKKDRYQYPETWKWLLPCICQIVIQFLTSYEDDILPFFLGSLFTCMSGYNRVLPTAAM
jgi:hypothetical protein